MGWTVWIDAARVGHIDHCIGPRVKLLPLHTHPLKIPHWNKCGSPRSNDLQGLQTATLAAGWPRLSLRNPGQRPHTFDSKQDQPLRASCTRSLWKACRGFEDSTPGHPAARGRFRSCISENADPKASHVENPCPRCREMEWAGLSAAGGSIDCGRQVTLFGIQPTANEEGSRCKSGAGPPL